jgi:hypothetical protein
MCSTFILSDERLEDLDSRENPTFEELCELIEGMTDRNLHIEARIKVAKYVKNKRLTKIYTAIQDISTAHGYLPHQVSDYRTEMESDLEIAVKYRLGEKAGAQLLSNL